MRDQHSAPPERVASVAPTGDATTDFVSDGNELSDDDLEHVVGGLARAWLTPDSVPPVPGEPRWGPHAGLIA